MGVGAGPAQRERDPLETLGACRAPTARVKEKAAAWDLLTWIKAFCLAWF